MSTAPQDPSSAAEQARARLHEEIERVRMGVEEMLAEQDSGIDPVLRRELDEIRAETRRYVRKSVRKAEKRLAARLDQLDARSEQLEQRLDGVEQERKYAEWRIHTNTEQMLDSLLREIRSIGDLLSRAR